MSERRFSVGDTVRVKANPLAGGSTPTLCPSFGDVRFAGKQVDVTGLRGDMAAVRRGSDIGNVLIHNLEPLATFSVGDRVRVSHGESVGAQFTGQRGVIDRGARYGFDWGVDFDDDGGYVFNSRELDPLTTVWKIVRVLGDGTLVSAFQGTGYAASILGPRQTYTPGVEVPLCVAYANEALAKDFATWVAWEGAPRELWRAEAVVDGGAPDDVPGVSCRHLVLIERVATHQGGQEVVDVPPAISPADYREKIAALEAVWHAALDREGAACTKLAAAREQVASLEATERALTSEVLALRAEARGKDDLLDALRERNDNLETWHTEDAAVVEAAVALEQWYPHGQIAWRDHTGKFKAAVEAHPSCQPVAPAPAPAPTAADRVVEALLDGSPPLHVANMLRVFAHAGSVRGMTITADRLAAIAGVLEAWAKEAQ